MATVRDDINTPHAKRPRFDYENPESSEFESSPDLMSSPDHPLPPSHPRQSSGDEDTSDSDHPDVLEELETQIFFLKKKVEKLESTNEQLTNESKSQKEFFSKQVEDMKKKILKLEEELKANNMSTSELQCKVEKLEEKVKEYEMDRDKLYLGQVAVEFEHTVCSHVLPEMFKNDTFATIKRLMRAIRHANPILPFNPKKKGLNKEKMLWEARKRWEKMCDDLKLPQEWKQPTGEENFNWDDDSVPDIIRAIRFLKETRNPVGHPTPVSVQKAEEIVSRPSDQWIQREFDHWQLQLVEDFIPSLRKTIADSGIASSIDTDRLQI